MQRRPDCLASVGDPPRTSDETRQKRCGGRSAARVVQGGRRHKNLDSRSAKTRNQKTDWCSRGVAGDPIARVLWLILLAQCARLATSDRQGCAKNQPTGLGIGCRCSSSTPCTEGLHCTSQFNDAMAPTSVLNSSEVEKYRGGYCMPCTDGDFCPYGTSLLQTLFSNELVEIGIRTQTNRLELTKSLLCPEGYYCPTPSKIVKCPEGWYCPVGSVQKTSCWLPQLFLNNPAVSVVQISDESIFDRLREGAQMIEGNICPAGSSDPSRLCPSGYYCPTPDEAYECPTGSYCPEGSTSPISCPWLSNCPQMATQPSISWAGPIVGAAVILLLGVCIAVGMWFERKRMAANEEYACKQERFAEIMTLAGLHKPELGAFEDIDVKLSVSFRELTLTLKNEHTILKGVTGTFHHSSLIAIMGGSGSGKTSFLNVLCGKATYGKTTGQVLLNGELTPLSTLRSVKGFVPQDDTVHEDLTVQENLAYSAAVRLPRSYTQAKRAQLVHATCDLLQLTPVMNSIVGSVERRGISGGQRKRVNIGVELVSSPSILFLDEPTSGLDSTMALAVLSGLKHLCQRGLTSIMVIHQPRPSIFNLFDQVLLLGVGGSQVYLGPSSLALPYFAHRGFVQPKNENLSDFLMDVIQGNVACRYDRDFDLEQLCVMWKQDGEAWVNSPCASFGSSRCATPSQSYDNLANEDSTSRNIPRLKLGLAQKFDEIDTDGDGFISFLEMRKFVRSLGHTCSNEDAGLIIQSMSDGRSCQTLSKSEFVKYGLRGGGAFAELIDCRTRQNSLQNTPEKSSQSQQPSNLGQQAGYGHKQLFMPSFAAQGDSPQSQMLHPGGQYPVQPSSASSIPLQPQSPSMAQQHQPAYNNSNCMSHPQPGSNGPGNLHQQFCSAISRSRSANMQPSTSGQYDASHLQMTGMYMLASENVQQQGPATYNNGYGYLQQAVLGGSDGAIHLQQQQQGYAPASSAEIVPQQPLSAASMIYSENPLSTSYVANLALSAAGGIQGSPDTLQLDRQSSASSQVLKGAGKKDKNSIASRGNLVPLKERDILNPVLQCWVIFKRCGQKWIRAWNLRIMDLAITTGVAAIIGSLQGQTWSLTKVGVNLLLCTLSMGIIITSASLPVFGRDTVMRWREVASGFSVPAIFIGTCVFDLLDISIRPLLFSAVYWSLTATDIPFSYFLLISWLISWWCSGLGYILSIVCNRELRVLAGACVPIILAGFLSGINPTLQSIGTSSPLLYVTYVSYARWGMEALMISYFSNVDLQFRIHALALLDRVGYCGFVFQDEFTITISQIPKILGVLKELNITELPAFKTVVGLLLTGFFPGIYDGKFRNATGILTAFEEQCSSMGGSVGATVCKELRRIYNTAVGYNRCSDAASSAVLILFFQGFVLRIFAFIALKLYNRRKQV